MNQKRNYFRTFASHTEEFSATSGRLIEEATNLTVHKLLAGHVGGEQQMASMIEQNQMDLIISLRDPYVGKRQEPDSNKIFRLCDTYIIPLATNLASAELLIKSLDRGELDWREIYK